MCDCIAETNAALAEHNARLDVPMTFDRRTGKRTPPKVRVPVYKLNPDKRDKLPILLAEYCPFCGEKYPELPEVSP